MTAGGGALGSRVPSRAERSASRRCPAPARLIEQIGIYIGDGGSGIVSLDRGSGSNGRLTGSGRELALFRLQSHGTGSVDTVNVNVESLDLRAR